MSPKSIAFFKFCLPVPSIPGYNREVDYKAEQAETQRNLGYRLSLYRAIGSIIVDTDTDAMLAFRGVDPKERAPYRNMLHGAKISDSERNANVIAHLACDILEHVSKPFDSNARLHHSNLGQPVEINRYLKEHWDLYADWIGTWNQFSLNYNAGSSFSTPEKNQAQITNGLPIEQVDIAIGDTATIRHLIQGGWLAKQREDAGTIEDAFVKAALMVHALVTVRS
jgi:hypothetical protein